MSPQSADGSNAVEADSPSGQPFRLLDLPPELRNNVYDKVIENYPRAYLPRLSGRTVASGSALLRVNRSVRAEFMNALYISATIVADVMNFDFSRIITFYNRLRDTHMKSLAQAGAKSERHMLIRLKVDFLADPKKLMRWLNRTQHPAKKGNEVKISYVADKRWSSHYLPRVDKKLKELPEGQVRWELMKIKKALRAPKHEGQ